MNSQISIQPKISHVCFVHNASPLPWAEKRNPAFLFQTLIPSSLSAHLCVERRFDLLTAVQVTFLTISEHSCHEECRLSSTGHILAVRPSKYSRFNLRVYVISECLWIGFWGQYVDLRGWRYRGEWSKWHSKVLHDLFSLIIIFGDKIIKNEMGEACGAWGWEERRGFM
jgi:hypothetical protein